ncbi:hypothetical protein TELCIR_11069, partial [Teladorsagia circumcincta]
MEIVLKKESHRKTPNVVSIRNNERLFGDAAQQSSVRYPASVYGHLLDLVAKHTNTPSALLFRQRFPHLAVEKHVNESSVVFPIGQHYKSQKDITTSERSMAKLFKEPERLKQVLSANLEYFAQVGSVYEDRHACAPNSDEFNQLIDDLMPRVATPLVQALRMADMQLDQ